MKSFWQAALICIQSSDKSIERATAIFKLGSLLDLKSSPIFPKLSVNIVVFQLILRILKPERVNQIKFGLCGPAHFAVLLIKSKPLVYAGLAIALLTKGCAKGDDGFDIIPDDYVRNFDPETNIPQADWLIAASLRNAQTPIPPGKDLGDYGGTKTPDVFAYFLHAGYSKVIALSCYESSADWLAHSVVGKFYEQYHPVESKSEVPRELGDPFDPLANIRMAAKLRENGWRILLKVNSEWASKQIEPSIYAQAALGNGFALRRIEIEKESLNQSLQPQSLLGGLISAQNANHWVMAKSIHIHQNGEIEATLYTWGKQYQPMRVPVVAFAKAYSGFVAAIG